jgi:hypothetical protein
VLGEQLAGGAEDEGAGLGAAFGLGAPRHPRFSCVIRYRLLVCI